MRRKAIAVMCIILLISIAGYILTSDEAALVNNPDSQNNSRDPNNPYTAPVSWTAYTHTPVLDPGHGGPDGGTESITGVQESQVNLEVALKTDLIMRFLGLKTVLTRDSDVSIHDVSAVSLYDKKVSDLRNRVSLVNNVENGVLLSIHQNSFDQSQYYGAQVFYFGKDNKPFADLMQETLRRILDPENNRKSKSIDTVYLLSNTIRPAVLIECGFLSNPQEEQLLLSPEYQRKMAMAITKGFMDWTRK